MKKLVWPAIAMLAFLLLAGRQAWVMMPISNEAWFGDAARHLAEEGRLRSGLLESRGTWMEGLEQHYYWVMPVDLVVKGMWFRLVGFGLGEMRAVSVLAGLGVLVGWGLVAWRLLASWRMATAVMVVLAVDLHLTAFVANGRMDALCAMWGVAGLAGYVWWRGSRPEWAVAAGHLGVALSGLTHPCGLVYAVDLVVLEWWWGGLGQRWAWRVAPYVVCGVPWAMWAGQDWAMYARQLGGNVSGLAGEYGGQGRFSVLDQPWLGIGREVSKRYLQSIGGEWAQWFVWAYGAGLVWVVVRQKRGLVVWLAAWHVVFFWWFEGLKLANYLLHLVPVLACVLVVALWDGYRPRVAVALLVVVGVVSQFEGKGRESYERVAAVLRQYPQATITGPGEFAFVVGFEGRLRDDVRLGYYTGRKADVIVTRAWQREWLEQARVREPEVARYVDELLKREYEEIYRDEVFVVVRRKGLLAP